MRNGLRGEASETNCHQPEPLIRVLCGPGDTSLARSGPKLGKTSFDLRLQSWKGFYCCHRAFDRGFSIIGDFPLPLQLLRELIKFSFYFLCQGVTSKDDDDDCRTCSQNQFSVLRTNYEKFSEEVISESFCNIILHVNSLATSVM